MPKDDAPPPALVGRAGLVFAYVCFAIAIATLAGALYLLPLDLKAKLFLGAAMGLVVALFAFMAVAAHLVYRAQAQGVADVAAKSRQKAAPRSETSDADGSQRPR